MDKDLYYILRYSFSFSLAAMFIFITMFNLMTISQTADVPIVLYLSMLNNIVGLGALLPVYLDEKWAWKVLSGWMIFYIGFLLYNILSGWVVNATGYLMFFFGIFLIFTLRVREKRR